MEAIKKKVAVLLTNSYLTSYGGIGPFVRNLDKDLNSYFALTYFFLPVELEKVKWIPHRAMYVAFLLKNYLKLKKFDLIISHSPEGSYVASYIRKPLVHIFHGNTNPMVISRFRFGKYFDFIFDHIHKVIKVKSALLFSVGEKREGVIKFINPISHEVEVIHERDRNGFIYAGRLEKPKGVHHLIKAYSFLPEKVREEHSLEIAGSGTELENLKGLALKLGLNKQVIFLGNMDNRDLIKVLSKNKILLMASEFEGFPMVIAEAFSVGVPVLTTSVGDIPEFVKNGINGFLFPVGFSLESYAMKIEEVLNNYSHYSGNALLASRVFNATEITRDFVYKVEERLSQLTKTV